MAKRTATDSQFEIDFYEKILQASPNFIEALSCLGDLYTRQGFYEKGLRVDERLAVLRPEDSTIFYNLACSYSLMGDVGAADRTMKRAITLGYDDFDHLQKDPDLLNLLGDEAFQSYFQTIRSRRARRTSVQGTL